MATTKTNGRVRNTGLLPEGAPIMALGADRMPSFWYGDFQYNAEAVPAPKVRSTEDLLRVLEHEIPDVLHLASEIMRDDERAVRVARRLVLDAETWVRAAAVALRDGVWPAVRPPELEAVQALAQVAADGSWDPEEAKMLQRAVRDGLASARERAA